MLTLKIEIKNDNTSLTWPYFLLKSYSKRCKKESLSEVEIHLINKNASCECF